MLQASEAVGRAPTVPTIIPRPVGIISPVRAVTEVCHLRRQFEVYASHDTGTTLAKARKSQVICSLADGQALCSTAQFVL